MAVAQQIKGQQAVFNSGGALALTTALQDASPAIANRKQKLQSLVITSDTTGVVVLADGASPNPNVATFGVVANTPLVIAEPQLQGLPQTSIGAALQIKAGGNMNVEFTGIVGLE